MNVYIINDCEKLWMDWTGRRKSLCTEVGQTIKASKYNVCFPIGRGNSGDSVVALS